MATHYGTSGDADALDFFGSALELGMAARRLKEVERDGVQIGREMLKLLRLRLHAASTSHEKLA